MAPDTTPPPRPRPNDNCHMTYKVEIRKNATGEVRVCQMALEWDKGDGRTDIFWWTDGNFACDCNRGTVFDDAGGVDTASMTDEEDALAYPCGMAAYTVIRAILPDGTVIAIDDPDE
jgi:hypothetical protein